MSTKQLYTPSSLPASVQTLLTLGQMLLLMLVWSIFFLWAVLTTENLLVPWLATLSGGQGFLREIFSFNLSTYLPAFGLVMISITLFFYRMPRSQDKLSVPIEFVLTILLFIAAQVMLVGFVLPWTEQCSPTLASSMIDQVFNVGSLMLTQTCVHAGSDLIVTSLLLIGLFALQASNRPWQYLRER